ncbi:MAG: MFS transporter [Acidimicrobiales bacterium]|jgi:EmrB/QacA subfamily drug resistance transporter
MTGAAPPPVPAASGHGASSPGYRWIVLSNTTLGIFMAMLNQSILIISLPAIFRGIHLDPLQPSNIGYLLWLLQGYMVVTAVLVVTFGRIGDIFGRVRMYNAGFAIFTTASLALAAMPWSGSNGATALIALRVVQGIGGALLMANSTAILTDAFPAEQRGMAMGFNVMAGIAASFIGLIVGGLLADIDWRLVFLVSVPFGAFGTVWAYLKLHDTGVRKQARIDYLGNATFAAGLVLVMVGLTYALQPYGRHAMGWTSPWVELELVTGVVLLVLFAYIETRVEDPMFHIRLFRIRAFGSAGLAVLLANMGRGGLQFMLILWLQGIWLPLHGFSYQSTPLWSGIYLIPMSVGFLATGPLAGRLSDRFGQRWFTTAGMTAAAVTFLLLLTLPVDFPYPAFAVLVFVNGLGVGMFSAPNATTMMNSVPPGDRGAASGMRATFMNSGFVLSIGLFFSLMIVGLSSGLPASMAHGLVSQGVPAATAGKVAALPAVATLFAAFLGFNPIRELLGSHVLNHIGAAHAAVLTGKSFFPTIVSGPFHHGLEIAFTASAVLCATAAIFSWRAGDCRESAADIEEARAHEEFVDGHSTVPIDGIDAALPDVVEV